MTIKNSIATATDNVASFLDAHSAEGAKSESKGFLSTLKGKVTASSALMSAMFFGAIMPAFADTSADNAIKNAGITTGSIDSDTSGLMSSLSGIVYLIMGVGALWAVAWIIIGGMLLAGSGSNPQKRSGGLAAIAVACIGGFIIYKAYTIGG